MFRLYNKFRELSMLCYILSRLPIFTKVVIPKFLLKIKGCTL